MKHNIVEGNVLIAIFMGFEKRFYKNPAYPEPYYDNDETRQYELGENQFEYHTDWNWLMPVVEKIAKVSAADFVIHFNVLGLNKQATASCAWLEHSYSPKNKNFKEKSESAIEATWLAVIDFIKYYNETIKQ